MGKTPENSTFEDSCQRYPLVKIALRLAARIKTARDKVRQAGESAAIGSGRVWTDNESLAAAPVKSDQPSDLQ